MHRHALPALGLAVALLLPGCAPPPATGPASLTVHLAAAPDLGEIDALNLAWDDSADLVLRLRNADGTAAGEQTVQLYSREGNALYVDAPATNAQGELQVQLLGLIPGPDRIRIEAGTVQRELQLYVADLVFEEPSRPPPSFPLGDIIPDHPIGRGLPGHR